MQGALAYRKQQGPGSSTRRPTSRPSLARRPVLLFQPCWHNAGHHHSRCYHTAGCSTRQGLAANIYSRPPPQRSCAANRYLQPPQWSCVLQEVCGSPCADRRASWARRPAGAPRARRPRATRPPTTRSPGPSARASAGPAPRGSCAPARARAGTRSALLRGAAGGGASRMPVHRAVYQAEPRNPGCRRAAALGRAAGKHRVGDPSRAHPPAHRCSTCLAPGTADRARHTADRHPRLTTAAAAKACHASRQDCRAAAHAGRRQGADTPVCTFEKPRQSADTPVCMIREPRRGAPAAAPPWRSRRGSPSSPARGARGTAASPAPGRTAGSCGCGSRRARA